MRGTLLLVLAAGCGSQASGVGLTFDPCDPVAVATDDGATAAQRASVDDAIAMWRARGAIGLGRGDASDVSIEFHEAGAAIYGAYDDATATVFVNTRVTDPSARAITIAHELGHALGLAHVDPAERISVMNPGNVTVAPNVGDEAALTALWGACPTPPVGLAQE